MSFLVLIGLSHSTFFFFSSRRRHTRFDCDWSSDVCSSDLSAEGGQVEMRLMTRTDVLCRSKVGGTAILFNLKSTSDPSEKWRLSFSRDQQTDRKSVV